MKKTLLTISLVACSVAAFAQGKVSFNIGAFPVKFDAANVLPADAALKGLAVPNAPASTPSGLTFWVGLYGGSSPGSITASTLTFLTTLKINDGSGFSDGRSPAASVNAASAIVGGQTAYLQLAAWSGADNTSRWSTSDTYQGVGNVFTMIPGSGSTYVSTLNGGGSTYQTAGVVNGSTSVIISAVVPEPGTFALAGLGAAAMLIFRRRK